ncbi:MAG TPA: DUF47 family protein [Stellaceae bacterium]|nr:DUF47 family protein [Stellaceae bacterium]
MTAKTQIVDFLGERALVLPVLLAGALAANERAKYVLSLLQVAASQAEQPQAPVRSLRAEREACGIAEQDFDRSVARAEHDGHGNYHIPGARRLVAILDDALRTMIAPLAVAGKDAPEAAERHAGFAERLERLIGARPPIADDMLSGELIAALTSARPKAGDGVHLLVLDLHQEINRLQSAIATAEVAGAKAYGLAAADRAAVAAFMAGVNRTAPLKFDHPGLDTIAARAGDTLLIQNDIGTTEAHVLVVRVSGLRVTLTYSDVHLPRVRFLQALCAGSGMVWEDIRSRQIAGIGEADLFYLALGGFTATDPPALHAFLERLGSRIVFLIDWNKARKRLGLLVANEAAIDILKWAADRDLGHRGFLKLGGERLIYDALEQAVKTPLRYGQPLHEMIGAEVAQDYLRFVLQIAATGLLQGQSEALIRDRIRAELFTHFRSAEQRFLAECAGHAEIVSHLAKGLRALLRQGASGRGEGLAEHAARAKLWESRADDVVKEMRSTVRRISGTEVFCRIVETADDAADDLEDATFLANLLFESAPPAALPEPLLLLADLLADGAQAFRRTMESAQYVRRGGERDAVQRFLEAADGVVTVEHQSDERERAVVTALMKTPLDARQLHMIAAIAHHLEAAADALLHASLKLRDHILGDVMFA